MAPAVRQSCAGATVRFHEETAYYFEWSCDLGDSYVSRYGPVALILFLVAAPLAIWGVTSGGSDQRRGLVVERSSGLRGEPELLISIDAENVRGTRDDDAVQLRCVDGNGKMVVSGTHPWPFAPEPGYDLPHTHQPVPQEKLAQARRCRLLGTNKKLEAGVL